MNLSLRLASASGEKVRLTGSSSVRVELVAGQARTLKAALEHRIGTRVSARRKDIVDWRNLLLT